MTKTVIMGPDWDQRVVHIRPQGKIALMMSGGVDSWVLYHIMKEYNPDIVVIDREDGIDNYKRVEELTGQSVIRIPETSTHSDGRIREGISIAEKTYDQVYMALNTVPPADHFPDLKDRAPYRPWKIRPPSKVVAPFLYLFKYHIIDYAIKNNIDLSHTRTCLERTDINCGECWQCREKNWAYEQLT